MKKKLTAVALIVCMIAIMLVGASLAYFTDEKEVENTFTVGNVEIKLNETEWEDEAEAVAPGDVYAKNPVVENVGANDAWIRVNVTLSDAAAFQTACAAHEITDLATIFDEHDEDKWTLAGIEADAGEDTLTYSYYYNELLAPDASTDALFTSVTIPVAFTSDEMEALGGDFTILITANAIQDYEGFAGDVEAAFAAYDVE